MAESSSLVVLAPYALREWGDRPRRFLDPAPLPPQVRAVVGAWFANDEELELKYHRRQGGPVRRMAAALALIIRNYATLRAAQMIYCLDGMHYAVLLMLAHSGWFSAEGKVVRRPAFHNKAWQKLAGRLSTAPAAFQIECITQEQYAAAVSHLGSSRVVFRPWKIDAEWFRPEPEALRRRALLPGNINRDDSLVPPLLHRGLSITRIARLASLPEHYKVEITNPRFELVTNASHREYRKHLNAAPAVLLPIVPCDGSAGLTAAMEAIAAGIPVLANRSMGLKELFAECRYPIPMLDDLDPDAWARAYRGIEEQHESPEFAQELETSRQLFLKHHSILPDGEDWAQIHASACASQRIAVAGMVGASSPA